MQALNVVHTRFPGLRVTWMCQARPDVLGVSFPVEFIVNPAQEDIPAVYVGKDCALQGAAVSV